MRKSFFPDGTYLFKVNNGNTRRACEIYSEFTIKTPERHHWRLSGVLYCSVSIVDFLQVNVSWEITTFAVTWGRDCGEDAFYFYIEKSLKTIFVPLKYILIGS